MGAMEVTKVSGNIPLRADAEEFWPLSESRGNFSPQLFRHASGHMPHAREGRHMPRQVREGHLPQVQIESQKTLNRLDAVPFTPGNGVLTPTDSNMALLWYQTQTGTPMTPYQPSPAQYQAVPVSPGWQMMVPASPGPAGYWSPMQPYPHAAVQYWDMPWHPPSMPSHAACSPEHARHGGLHWQPSPPPQMPRTPQARQPPHNMSSPSTPKNSSPGSSPMGHHNSNGGPHSGPGGLKRPFVASINSDSSFAAVVCQNFAVLAKAAAKDAGDGGSKLQSMVAELESLMTLQGVNAALPSKAFEESALLHKSKQGNGQNAGNGHLVGPKTKAAAALQTAPDSSSMSAAKGDRKAQERTSDGKTGGSHRDIKTPLLNARSRRSLRRAIQRAVDEAARSGVQLSADLEDLPQLNSSPAIA